MLGLGNDTTKIIVHTKGTMDDITPEMKRLLDFIDGKEPENDLARELDEEVGLYDFADELLGKI